ncbi:hypothetical protein H0H92_014503 [Tricholoma furcatifolium]|nr:hypothetical protein H0H92_014503 [Tricholoma furcatifolium]
MHTDLNTGNFPLICPTCPVAALFLKAYDIPDRTCATPGPQAPRPYWVRHRNKVYPIPGQHAKGRVSYADRTWARLRRALGGMKTSVVACSGQCVDEYEREWA